MKILKNIALGLATIAMVSLTSCADDYLDTTPSNAVGEVTVYSTLDNLYMALNGVHRNMVSYDSGYQCLGGEPGFAMCRDIEADDITWKTNTWCKAAYLGWSCNTLATSGYNYMYWYYYYQWILNCNKILEGLEEVEVSDQSLWNQIKGEALCHRGWCHMNLLQLYAQWYGYTSDQSHDGIIYRTSSETCEQARSSFKECVTLAMADFDEAATLLSGITPNDINHYDESCVWGMKARLALMNHDYSNAATYAEKSISLAETAGRKLMSGDDLYHGFATISTSVKEAMYAALTTDEQSVYFYSFYAYMSWNFSSSAIRQGVKCISQIAYDTMSDTDLRLEWWNPDGTAEVPLSTYATNTYQNRKFEAVSTASAVGDFAFMRLAEMYLTAAEAYAHAGNNTKAQEIFTTFQVTRDPSYVSQGNTGDDLVDEILNSRRVELWGEGFRFNDLKRLHKNIERGSNFVLSFATFLEKDADADGWAWEIPEIETNYNTLCTTNY